MGDDAETFEQGLESGKLSVNFRQDFGASGIDTRLYSWWKNGTKLYGLFKPVNASTTTTNPEYRVRVKVFSVVPLSGSHGQLLENKAGLGLLSATSTSSAYNGITRATSS